MSRPQAVISAAAPEGARALRIREFCARYRIGRTKLYELLGAGKIRAVKVTGRVLIPVDEGERILREGCE